MAEVDTKGETVEVPEVVAPEAPNLPTRDELREKGWSAKELDSAEKRGMIAKAEEKKEAPKAEEKVQEPEVKKPEEKKPDPVRRGTPLDGVVLTPEQQKAFEDAFGVGSPVRGLYFRAKNERSARQRAEQERDAERKTRMELEAKLAAKPKEDAEIEDPEDKPLTVKELKALRDQEAREFEEKQKQNTERAEKVASAQVEQEEYVRAIYTDFDGTVGLAKEVMQNLDAILPEKYQQAKALKLIRDLQIAAANADKMDLDDFNAAHIAYELGRLHPKYGKSAEKEEKPGAKTDPKANGGRTPDELERMKRNAQQRPSSASVPQGGAKRTVTAEEVTAEDLNRMSSAERLDFRKKHQDRYMSIVRG